MFKANTGFGPTRFSVRGDGLVAIVGTLTLLGGATVTGATTLEGVLTALTGIRVAGGGLTVIFSCSLARLRSGVFLSRSSKFLFKKFISTGFRWWPGSFRQLG